jgi:hypothetical protein
MVTIDIYYITVVDATQMFEKIKAFFKAQTKKIPPLWQVYASLAHRFDIPFKSHLALIGGIFDTFDKIWIPASFIKRHIMLAAYFLIIFGVLVLGGFQPLVLGTYYTGGCILPTLVAIGVTVVVALKFLLDKTVGAIGISLIGIGVYFDDAHAIVAKAELNAARNLGNFDVKDVQKDWEAIQSLYKRAEYFGHKDAHRLMIDKAVALDMRNLFSVPNQKVEEILCGYGCPHDLPACPPIVEFSDDLKQEIFEKMIQRRYVSVEHRESIDYLLPVRSFKEDNHGIPFLLYAIQDLQFSLKNFQDLNKKIEEQQDRIRMIAQNAEKWLTGVLKPARDQEQYYLARRKKAEAVVSVKIQTISGILDRADNMPGAKEKMIAEALLEGDSMDRLLKEVEESLTNAENYKDKKDNSEEFSLFFSRRLMLLSKGPQGIGDGQSPLSGEEFCYSPNITHDEREEKEPAIAPA